MFILHSAAALIFTLPSKAHWYVMPRSSRIRFEKRPDSQATQVRARSGSRSSTNTDASGS